MYYHHISHSTGGPRVCWGAAQWVLLTAYRLSCPMCSNTTRTICTSRHNRTNTYAYLYTSTQSIKDNQKLTQSPYDELRYAQIYTTMYTPMYINTYTRDNTGAFVSMHTDSASWTGGNTL